MSNTTNIKIDPNRETAWQKTVRKGKEEPMVPLGMVLTTAALIGATSSMRKGNRTQFNRMLRFRVIAQGFTVVAALGGSVYYGEKRRLEKQEEKKRTEKEKRDVEFAKSMKIAEAAHAGQA